MDQDRPLLSFDRLDDLEIAAAAHDTPSVGAFTVDAIGPYAEWYWLRRAGRILGSLYCEAPISSLHSSLIEKERKAWVAGDGKIGFIRVHRAHEDTEQVAWVSFRQSMKRAATSAGISNERAGQLVGAIGELEDNIHWHSEAPASGVCLFQSHESAFEFVILDTGIGVLDSLKTSDEFKELHDYGRALMVATQDGNSRFGRSSDRGWGYHDLFVGLTNANAQVRFRSGDYAMILDGIDVSVPQASIRQRVYGQGLYIRVYAAELKRTRNERPTSA
jgi:anti-sigma regulatory factor (Ser/Thr protein kinase)